MAHRLIGAPSRLRRALLFSTTSQLSTVISTAADVSSKHILTLFTIVQSTSISFLPILPIFTFILIQYDNVSHGILYFITFSVHTDADLNLFGSIQFNIYF